MIQEEKKLPEGLEEAAEKYIREIVCAASNLVDAVERYVNPQKGQFCHRSELLIVKDKLKELLK